MQRGLGVFRILYVQVLAAVVLGVATGALWPDLGASLKPLGDAFIKLIKMVVAPVSRLRWSEVAELPGTARGAGGFGSTGTGSGRA